MSQRWSTQAITVPLSLPQALAVVRSKQNPVLDDLSEEYQGKVVIQFKKALPAVTLVSRGYELDEVHFKVVERLQEFRDFCVLDMKIENSEMGRFIGRNGRNIDSLKYQFDEVEIRAGGRNSYKNVTIAGKESAVEQACGHIEQLYHVERVEYQTFQVRGRHAPTRDYDEDDYDDDDYDDDDYDDLAWQNGARKREVEAVFYKYQATASIVEFIKKSGTSLKKLQRLFRKETLLINENEGIVTVVGQTDNIDLWERDVKASLTDFFNGFLSCQEHFPEHTKITKSYIYSDDLDVIWDHSGLTATVRGLKEKVTEKLNEFETIKNRLRSVCVKFTCEKSLYLFMKRNMKIDDTTTTDGSHITLRDGHVEYQSKIREIDSYEEWSHQHKKAFQKIMRHITCQKVEVPPIYSGQMRTECCQHNKYVVEWIQEESALLIYGLKQHVLEITKTLQGVLYDLKNKKKNVSMQYQCTNAEIFSFIKESTEHFENLVKHLSHLGSPVLDSNIVTVNAEILEVESTSKWKEKCRTSIEQCLLRYDVAWIKVEDDIQASSISLAESGSGVVTKWIESEGAFCIIGIKQLVVVSERRLKDEIKKNRLRSVCVKFTCEKSLYLFMKRNMKIDDTTTADGSHITLRDGNVEYQSKIREIDSYEEWSRQRKKALLEFMSQITHQKVEVPPIYSGQMRAECCQHNEYVVEWIQEESALLIYGLKQYALEVTIILQGILFNLKNKKKNVSMQYQCTNAEIFSFIKESTEHFENLVKHLGHLGSPVLDSNIVTVNAEILEVESTSKWQEKCRTSVEQYLLRYDVARIKVEDDIQASSISLAESGSGVVTRWIESEGAFCIIGIKQLVDVSERCLKDKINKLREDESLLNSEDESVGTDIESSVVIPVNGNVMRYLHMEESRKSMPGVRIAKAIGRVKITGKGRKLQNAKEYIESLCVENLSMKRFGVCQFLEEASTRWQIEALQIENNCSIHVERLPDLEYGAERYVLLPKNSNVSITVKVEEGDITGENVDLIVNTTNKTFSFDGPLSTFVFQKAGDHLRNFIDVIDRDIRFSESGMLNCKVIFHVAIPKTGESMEDLILKILRKADEMEMKSIAMPTIGAGSGGWKSQDISIAMQNAFTKFARESVNLKLVKVILYSAMSTSEKQPFHRNVKIQNQREDTSPPEKEQRGFFSFIRNVVRRPKSTPVQRLPPRPTETVAPARTRGTEESQHARILISATNQADLDKAVDEVKKLTSHYIQEFEFDQLSVLRISQSELDQLEKMANKYNVRVIVNKKRDIHKIIVQGSHEGASKVKNKVQEILGGTSSDLPAEWIPSEEKMISVSLDRNSSEYRDIEELFLEGNKRSLSLSVCLICRIQNPALYRQYQSKKGEIANRANPPNKIEMRLFHGTDENTINLICRDGFNRSYAGKNATLYGKGTYFSTESSYSNSYAAADGMGRRQMFVADVLTGDYCKGDSSMIDAPRNPATQELYDSVVDQSGYSTPTIYVVFRDWSVYPSYVITYTTN